MNRNPNDVNIPRDVRNWAADDVSPLRGRGTFRGDRGMNRGDRGGYVSQTNRNDSDANVPRDV